MSKFLTLRLLAVLSVMSLVFYSLHWLTAPPGISGDASRLGLYAHDFAQEGLIPFYIYHQFAPHPLIIYIQSLVFPIIGYTNSALRGITIVGGALATPAIFWATRCLFHQVGTEFALRAGLVAAIGLSLSTFFASFSRYGIEGALLPVVELMVIAFLWRGFRGGRWTDFALAGLFVGLSQYVYIVARFFPIALGVASMGALLADRTLLARWRGLVVAAAVAAGVALPQWILFATHPYTFFARTLQSAGRIVFDVPAPLTTIAEKALNQLLMLGWHWQNAYNPHSEKALLTPVLVASLAVGIGITAYKRKAAYLFGLIMMLAMLLPDLLAYEGTKPAATRLVPALPFILMMAGLGASAVWGWLRRSPRIPPWIGLLIPLVVLSSGLLRQWDYATRVKPQDLGADGLEWRASLVEIAVAGYINNHAGPPILLPASEYRRAPLAFLLAESFPRRAGGLDNLIDRNAPVTVLQTTEPDRPTTEGIPSGYVKDDWVLLRSQTAYLLPPIPGAILLQDGEEEAIYASNGALVAKAFPARWQGEPATPTALQGSFSNGLNLVGYRSNDFSPGTVYDVALFWQPERKIGRDVEMFVQLIDQNSGIAVANIHSWPLNGVYRVRAWKPQDTIPVRFRLAVPGNLAPGPYQLRTGIVDLMGRNRVSPVAGGDSFHIKTVKVPLPVDDRVPEVEIDINFDDIIALDGYTATQTSEGVRITLFWRAIDFPVSDYVSFVHIVDSEGAIVAQSDLQPRNGHYPTSIWSPNEPVVDERVLPPVPEGAYQVYIGWYQQLEGGWERLSTVTTDGSPATDRPLLANIEIR